MQFFSSSSRLSYQLICFAFAASLVVAQDYTCSATKACTIGCCGKSNVCGLGPTFCGVGNCTGNCDYKSECDPGWGPEWSAAETCPLNVCCSRFGFCGTTADFCGDVSIRNPSCSGTSASQRTIAYYEGWATSRDCDVMYPEQIPVASYTHLNFAFASIDPNSFAVVQMDPGDTNMYSRLTGLKSISPGLQVWISIGGWSMNDPDQPTATTFSDLAGSSQNQQKFFQSLLSLMHTYGFDGVDIDWEYPGAADRSGRPEDFANYVTLLRNLRNFWQAAGHNYGLSITIPSSFWYLRNFDIVNLANEIDWFNMMTYDLHGVWDATDKFIGPQVAAHTNLTEIDEALKLLWRNHVDPSKVTLGLGFYGRSFTLSDPSCNTAGCPFSEAAPAGPCTQSPGTLSFAEIERLVAGGAKPVLDQKAAVQTLVYDTNNWVSYDDVTSFKMKIDYANSNCLGGTMVWAVSLDSALGTASSALSANTGQRQKFGLSRTIVEQTSQCLWTNCGATCPNGMTPAADSGGGQETSDRQCPKGKVRSFCCPIGNVPICRWEGGGTPFCGGSYCPNDGKTIWINVGSSTTGCATSHLALCCEPLPSVQKIGDCQWEGTSPLCTVFGGSASCDHGQTPLTTSSVGDGGEQPCFQGSKSFCCTNPPPYTNCAWYTSGDNIINQCSGMCPTGMAVLSVDPKAGNCATGAAAFCCDIPSNSPPIGPITELDTLTSMFLKNPKCQAYDQDTFDYRKRSEALDDSATLHARKAPGLGIGAVTSLYFCSKLLNNIFYPNPAPQEVQEDRDALDARLKAAGYPGVSTSRLQPVLEDPTLGDPLETCDYLFCNLDSASSFLDDYFGTAEELCVCPLLSSLSRRSDVQPSTMNVSKREVGPSSDPNAAREGGKPSMGRLLTAIANGLLRFEYWSWFRYGATGQGGTARANGQIELEVVYLLGSDMNHIDPDLQTTTNGVVNNFVILHFHLSNQLVSGQTQLGVSQINVRHGSGIRRMGSGLTEPVSGPWNNHLPDLWDPQVPGNNNEPEDGLWRVQPELGPRSGGYQSNIHGRAILNCPTNRPRWCPEEQILPPPNPTGYSQLIRNAVDRINFDTDGVLTSHPPNLIDLEEPGVIAANYGEGTWPADWTLAPYRESYSYAADGSRYSPPSAYNVANGLLGQGWVGYHFRTSAT